MAKGELFSLSTHIAVVMKEGRWVEEVGRDHTWL